MPDKGLEIADGSQKMIDYEIQLKAADALANVVDNFIREKQTLAELTAVLLEYRAAQVLIDEELSTAFAELQEQMEPILDYEKKNLYRNGTKQAKDSKERS